MKPKDSPKPHRSAPGLEREKVVTVALDLLEEVGFEGLTLRKLADKLHVKAAALYWHFENKQDLIDKVAERIIEDEFVAQSDAEVQAFKQADWRKVLTTMGYGMRNALHRHRDGALVIANADLARSKTFKGRAVMIEKLLDEGFTMPQVFSAMFAVGRFTLGCVFEEQADPRMRVDMKQLYAERLKEAMKERPEIATMLNELGEEKFMNPDYQYEQGLQIILDGIEVQLAKSS